MADAGMTNVFIFDNYIALFADGIDAGEHKHGAYQLSMSLDGAQHRCGPTSDDMRVGLGHLVAPNTPHCLNSESGQQVLFLIAPQSTIARRLGARHLNGSGFGVLPEDKIDRHAIDELHPAIDEAWSATRVKPACDALLESFAESPLVGAADLHPSILAAVNVIHDELRSPISADKLADRVGLSTSRLLHLFKEQMGTPLRPHIQWLRLTDAMAQIVNGTSITDAAARAGFSDGAHLTRSMRQYLGLRPSDLLSHPDFNVELHVTSPVG